jgi:ribonucleoside-diphosphate reductase beta chain
MSQIRAPLIFNPAGDDSIPNRSIWNGNTTNLIQLNEVKYPWAIRLYKQMRENFWIPEKIDLTTDVTNYQELTHQERRAYNGILSYLTFLDSIQTCNIPFLKTIITAPEIHLCMAEQLSQEALHNNSYQVIIDAIIPIENRNQVYELWREDAVLSNRCNFIATFYQQYIDDPSPANYFISLLANYLLEGLYFYNGFTFFYNLAMRQLMPGTADMFKLINKDELSHVRLYQEIIPEAMQTFPHDLDQIYDMFDTAVQHERTWTDHIIGDEILGINKASTQEYTQYLANIRLRAIGLNNLYPVTTNPYAHLDRFADTSKAGTTKANFFESGVTSYNQSSAIEWDF